MYANLYLEIKFLKGKIHYPCFLGLLGLRNQKSFAYFETVFPHTFFLIDSALSLKKSGF